MLAALVGTVLLGQLLAPHEWLGIAVVVLSNAAAVATSHRGTAAPSDGASWPVPPSTSPAGVPTGG